MFKYVEFVLMGFSEEGKFVIIMVQVYDFVQFKNLMCFQMMGVLMMGVMYLYFKYINFFFIQSIIFFKGVFEVNFIKIYVWGQFVFGDFKCLFKQVVGFMSGFQNGFVQSDKKVVELVECVGCGGVKEEQSIL